ncbi:hypothetical protein [Pseudonocardia sp. GCM10023141]|uniref:hypothetical protein n=1 Tax=Pseudonocardia sp. GCM10023141 TaxID=3252653 RepID=UPI0036221341
MIALRVERVARQVDVLLWAGVALGLLFTAVNVQRFAAGDAPPFSAVWWAAWLLDPMVSLVLLAVIRAEQITSGQQLPSSTWARVTKWATFTATYVMNTWEAWGLDGDPMTPAGVVLHSIPPLLVVLAAEAGPELRERLAQTAHVAGHGVVEGAGEPGDAAVREPVTVPDAATSGVHELGDHTVHESRRPGTRKGRRTSAGRTSSSRRLLDDYLADAHAALAAARSSGEPPSVTPSWCRAVTGCSAGTSVKLAAALRATVTATAAASS